MLFLQDEAGKPAPKAYYLLGDDMQQVIQKQVEANLREHGYPTGEAPEVARDMSFLRAKRLLIEQLSRQLWSLLLRGAVLSGGALMALGMKEYLGI